MENSLSKKNLGHLHVLGTLISTALLCFCYLYPIFLCLESSEKVGGLFLFSNFVIVLFCIVGLALESKPYTLMKVQWFFIFFFLGLAPLYQTLTGYVPWDFSVSIDLKIKANCVIILWEVVSLMAILAHRKRKKNCSINNNVIEVVTLMIPNSDTGRFLMALVSSVFFIGLIGLVGFNNLAVRGEANVGDVGSPLVTVLNYFLRSAPVFVLGYFIIQLRDKQMRFQLTSILLLLFLFCETYISNNPESMSRFQVAAVYLGIILLMIKPTAMKSRTFEILFVLVIVVAFPFFSLLKRLTMAEALSSGFFSNFELLTIFNNVDFDAYSMLCRIIRQVDYSGLMLGRQILSTLFFFVPRAVIPIKGVPTGTLIAELQHQWYTNLSAPVIGEAFIDFGYLGIIVYALVLTVFLIRIDENYWRVIYSYEKNAVTKGGVSYIELGYPFAVGFLFYIMRGALQPTFLRFMGFYLFLICIFVFQRFVVPRRFEIE